MEPKIVCARHSIGDNEDREPDGGLVEGRTLHILFSLKDQECVAPTAPLLVRDQPHTLEYSITAKLLDEVLLGNGPGQATNEKCTIRVANSLLVLCRVD